MKSKPLKCPPLIDFPHCPPCKIGWCYNIYTGCPIPVPPTLFSHFAILKKETFPGNIYMSMATGAYLWCNKIVFPLPLNRGFRGKLKTHQRNPNQVIYNFKSIIKNKTQSAVMRSPSQYYSKRHSVGVNQLRRLISTFCNFW